jgi:hypothetical protein
VLVGVAVGLGETVPAGVGDGVGLGAGLGVGGTVGLGVGTRVGLCVAAGVALAAGDGVALGDGTMTTLAGTSVAAGAPEPPGRPAVGDAIAAIPVGDAPTTGIAMPPRCTTKANDSAALSMRISSATTVARGIAGVAPFPGDDASIAPRR